MAAVDDENIIGRGAFCTKFKAVTSDRSVVTVKIFREDKTHFFLPIYDNVSKLQHKNIVRVLGNCYEYSGRVIKKAYLVEEYVPNGSLLDVANKHGSQLEWSSVFRIIEGVAEALNYLHAQRIVHKDVKPSNILLDSDMNQKITDFDTSKLLDADEITTSEITGTLGYISPDFLYDGIISAKNDVYAFGVTLLHTVSYMCRSKPPSQKYVMDNFFHIWAREASPAGRVEELFDPSLFDCSQLKDIKRCIDVGFLCVQPHRVDRPSMAEVLEMLNCKGDVPMPKKPGHKEQDEEEPACGSAGSSGTA